MRRLILLGGLVGLFFLPSTAYAYHEWCQFGFNITPNPVDKSFLVGYRNCVYSSGQGHELAITTFGCCTGRTGQIAGDYVVRLDDNNYPMAYSSWFVNPYIPVTKWAGWIYHPYWGRYCSRSFWWFANAAGDAVSPTCVWTNGYQ